MSQPANTQLDAGFTLHNHGSIWLCEPKTDEAYDHLSAHVNDEAK